MPLTLTSDAFSHGDMIPVEYTCDGDDFSPHLEWSGAPEGTKSFVMICDDPDAPMGIWDHWILFNIPTDATQIEPHALSLPPGTDEGTNSWGRTGYGGPCPPSGTHHYFFKLYALDTELDIHPGAKKLQIEAAMGGHILAETELMAKYERLAGIE